MEPIVLPNGAALVPLVPDGAPGHRVAMAQNFSVEWLSISGRPVSVVSRTETIIILCAGAARLANTHAETLLDGPSVAIAPAGSQQITLTLGGPLLILATDRTDLDRSDTEILSHPPDGRIAPIEAPFDRKAPLKAPLVTAFDGLPNPSNNPRIRFFQSATMSVNLVRYEGARDAKSLSPHSHKDIEQGTLAVTGRYMHHLRTPWVPDKSLWREDAHIEAGPGTLLLIPPEIIHTTQGVGDESHLLVDIFAPPRRDFIAKGFVANAGDYTDPQSAARHLS